MQNQQRVVRDLNFLSVHVVFGLTNLLCLKTDMEDVLCWIHLH